MSRKRLLPDEVERIIELKLQRMPVRAIAEQVGCAPRTVQETWKRYLRERTVERKAEMDAALEESLARTEQIAIDARRGYQRALRDGELRVATAFLREERTALEQLAKYGAVRDMEPEHAAEITEAQAEALANALRKTLAGLGLSQEQHALALTAVRKHLAELDA